MKFKKEIFKNNLIPFSDFISLAFGLFFKKNYLSSSRKKKSSCERCHAIFPPLTLFVYFFFAQKEMATMNDSQLSELSVKELKERLRILGEPADKMAGVREKSDFVKMIRVRLTALNQQATAATSLTPAAAAVARKEEQEKIKQQRDKMRQDMEQKRKEFKEEYERLTREVGIVEATKRIFAKQREEAKKNAELMKGSNGLAMHVGILPYPIRER